MTFRGHRPSPKRQARKVRDRVWAVQERATQQARIVARQKAELQSCLRAVSFALRSTMAAEGHPVVNGYLPGLEFPGSENDRLKGSYWHGNVQIYPAAFASGVHCRTLVHELTHAFDGLATGEAYLSADVAGYEGYLNQRCEMLARSFEERWEEFFPKN